MKLAYLLKKVIREGGVSLKKTALLFPGHGSQYSGMAKKWLEFWMVPRIFELASDTLGIDVKKICIDGDAKDLNEYTQPIILTASYVAYQVLIDKYEFSPEFLAGHSLGEFTALTCAGALEFEHALKIVYKRGELMKQVASEVDGSMVALMGLSAEEISKTCKHISKTLSFVTISNFNSEDQHTISGQTDAVKKAVSLLEAKGARPMEVNINAPYHSVLMQAVVEPLKVELSKYKINTPNVKVISNTKALPFDNEDDLREALAFQIVRPVKWYDSIGYMVRSGIDELIEVGPQAILRNLMMFNEWDANFYSFDDRRDEELIHELLGMQDPLLRVDKARKIALLQGCLAEAISTQNRNEEISEYRSSVLLPYKELKAKIFHLSTSDSDIASHHLNRSLQTLKKIMVGKGVPIQEQRQRFKRILYETGLFDYFEDYLHA